MGRHADRIALAKEFGATDVVSERGAEAVERVKELTRGHGVPRDRQAGGRKSGGEAAMTEEELNGPQVGT